MGKDRMKIGDSAAGRGGLSGPRIVATVLLPFGLGYYLSYLYRTMNAVLAPQLVAELGLTAAELGFLTAVYFVTFAAIQLPLGLFLDRYGPRRAQAVLLVAAAIGGVVFGLGHNMVVLGIGRALIGLGVAGAFMALLKANAVWWPADRLPLLNGVAASFGSLGALTATAPVELALGFIDWRGIFLIIAGLTVLLAVVTWFVVPESGRSGAERAGLAAQIREIGAVYTDPYFWRFGIMIIFGFGAYISYQTLWAGPWLRDVAGFDRMGVANRLLLFGAVFAIQWGIGGVIGLWPEGPGGSYDPAGHQAALVGAIGLQVIGYLWFVWPRRGDGA